MKPTTSVPRIALEAGLPARFQYWSGGSGRRYLFTRTDIDAVHYFDNAVVIVARYGRIVWAGHSQGHDYSNSTLNQLSQRDGAKIFIHLLARNDAQRSEIILDLSETIEVDQVDAAPTARILEFPTAA